MIIVEGLTNETVKLRLQDYLETGLGIKLKRDITLTSNDVIVNIETKQEVYDICIEFPNKEEPFYSMQDFLLFTISALFSALVKAN